MTEPDALALVAVFLIPLGTALLLMVVPSTERSLLIGITALSGFAMFVLSTVSGNAVIYNMFEHDNAFLLLFTMFSMWKGRASCGNEGRFGQPPQIYLFNQIKV